MYINNSKNLRVLHYDLHVTFCDPPDPEKEFETVPTDLHYGDMVMAHVQDHYYLLDLKVHLTTVLTHCYTTQYTLQLPSLINSLSFHYSAHIEGNANCYGGYGQFYSCITLHNFA